VGGVNKVRNRSWSSRVISKVSSGASRHRAVARVMRSSSGKSHVVQLEVGAGDVGDRAEGVSLVAGPAAEVEDHGPARSQHLVGNPDEPAFQNVALPTEVGPPNPEQRRHPLVGCQPQGTAGSLQLASKGRLARARQADREMQPRPRTHGHHLARSAEQGAIGLARTGSRCGLEWPSGVARPRARQPRVARGPACGRMSRARAALVRSRQGRAGKQFRRVNGPAAPAGTTGMASTARAAPEPARATGWSRTPRPSGAETARPGPAGRPIPTAHGPGDRDMDPTDGGEASGTQRARKKVSPGRAGADLHQYWWAILGLNQ
jgi:hypothetical protein